MKKRLIEIIICMLLVGTVLPVSGTLIIDNITTCNVSGNTLYVGGSGEGNYTFIQDAIDNASDDDTVFVYAYSSPYYENLIINKSINLIGEDKDTTVIDGNHNYGEVVYITADRVNINTFTIQNSGHAHYHSGIKISSEYNTISDNNILDNNIGIYLYESNNTITGNTILNNYYGIKLRYSSGNTIKDNNISNNGNYGIYLESSGFNSIIKNNFFSNKNSAYFEHNLFILPILYLERCPNTWKQNYWDETQLFLKLIKGTLWLTIVIGPMGIFRYPISTAQIDWSPAKEPYDI
jgi:parallel beta-helix repeat protein